ncbi:MAG: hypothetical protein FWD57_09935 [Polyangiaceae bacterium]|nr:hypothetical protein [Polyangiaceae bacterium]
MSRAILGLGEEGAQAPAKNASAMHKAILLYAIVVIRVYLRRRRFIAILSAGSVEARRIGIASVLTHTAFHRTPPKLRQPQIAPPNFAKLPSPPHTPDTPVRQHPASQRTVCSAYHALVNYLDGEPRAAEPPSPSRLEMLATIIDNTAGSTITDARHVARSL